MATSTFTLFQLAPNDQSIYYLNYIFGSVGTVLSPSNATNTTQTINIVGTMFHYLNTLALTVGALMVVYTVVVGLLKTASEGEFLGKHWNSLWVPVRTVIGIAALFPTGSGYSGLQVVMMWIIMQGVAAGDTMWTTALNYYNVAGSPFATFSISGIPAATNMQNLYAAMVCHTTAAQTSQASYTPTGKTNNVPFFFCGDPSINPYTNPAAAATPYDVANGFCSSTAYPLTSFFSATSADTVPLGPYAILTASNSGYTIPGTGAQVVSNASCGSVTLCDIDSYCRPPTMGPMGVALPGTGGANYSELGCLVCKAQRDAVVTAVASLAPFAEAYSKADAEYIDFTTGSAVPTTTQYLLNYCQAIGVGADDCCSTLGDSNGQCSSAQAKIAVDYFAKLSNTSNDPTHGYANAANKTITDLYYPYVFKQTASGAPASSGSGKSNDFLDNAVGAYTQAISTVISTYMANLSQQSATNLKGWLKDAQGNGWMMAGGYYYEMANADSQNQTSLPTLTVLATDPATDSNNELYSYRNNVSAAGILLHSVMNQQSGSSSFASLTSQAPALGQMGYLSSSAGTGILNLFRDMLTGNGGSAAPGSINVVYNPLAKLHAFGEGLMITADVVVVALFAIFMVIFWSSGWNVWVLGNGLMTPLSNAAIVFVMIVLPIALAFVAGCYTFGGLIAVYMPLVPYIIYSLGVVGWLMATVEAMVAMPFVALGIMSPSGEHEIMGRSHHALSHIFNLFLRPSLMVFGMIASMLVASAAVTFINASFAGVMDSINGNPELIELFIFIAAYVSLVLAVLNKVFTLIYVIPQQVLTWIGMQAVSYGEQEAMQGIRQAVEGAGGAVGGALQGAGRNVGGRIEREQDTARAEKKQDDKKSPLGVSAPSNETAASKSTPSAPSAPSNTDNSAGSAGGGGSGSSGGGGT